MDGTLLLLQMSYELSEIPEGHVGHSKIWENFYPLFVDPPSRALKTLCGSSGKSLILTPVAA